MRSLFPEKTPFYSAPKPFTAKVDFGYFILVNARRLYLSKGVNELSVPLLNKQFWGNHDIIEKNTTPMHFMHVYLNAFVAGLQRHVSVHKTSKEIFQGEKCIKVQMFTPG